MHVVSFGDNISKQVMSQSLKFVLLESPGVELQKMVYTCVDQNHTQTKIFPLFLECGISTISRWRGREAWKLLNGFRQVVPGGCFRSSECFFRSKTVFHKVWQKNGTSKQQKQRVLRRFQFLCWYAKIVVFTWPCPFFHANLDRLITRPRC